MRILIVEDDKKIAESLKKSLEAECFVVDTAYDGDKGLYMARTNEYDLIILDNMLPGKTGLELCRELRTEGHVTPILGLSVKSEVKNKVNFLDAGADDYLTKPFSFNELLARIRALLRRPTTLQADILRAGDIVLDCRKNIVMKKNQEVYLTRKEFMLLEYLMKNKGSVLSRGMILEHVWDVNADPFSNTIESHILSLRRKLQQNNGKNKMILTIPGRGYKIEG